MTWEIIYIGERRHSVFCIAFSLFVLYVSLMCSLCVMCEYDNLMTHVCALVDKYFQSNFFYSRYAIIIMFQ